MDKVDVGFGIDNISIEPTTGAIYGTGLTNAIKFLKVAHSESSNSTSPTIVKKITINSGQDQFYGKKVIGI